MKENTDFREDVQKRLDLVRPGNDGHARDKPKVARLEAIDEDADTLKSTEAQRRQLAEN